MRYQKSKVSILIPAKNEGEGLRKIIRSVKPYGFEIIVVDGHSTDNSKEITESEGAIFLLDHGLGRGDGVRMGLKKAKGPIILMFDADGSHKVEDIPKLVDPIFKGQADLVVGSRRLGGSMDLDMTIPGVIRSGGADFLTALVNHKFGTELSDILYSFRVLTKKAANKVQLTADKFAIEQELVVECLKKGLKVVQVPTQEQKRGWGKSKLKTSAGVKLLFDLINQLYF